MYDEASDTPCVPKSVSFPLLFSHLTYQREFHLQSIYVSF